MFLSSFSLIAVASNGVESVNSYVEEKHSATNFNARQQSSSGQRSSSGYDFVVTVERENVSNAGTITLDRNDDGGTNHSVNTSNYPINSYLVYLNDDHSKSDRQNKIGQIVFSNEIYGIEYGSSGTISLSNVSKSGATYPTSSSSGYSGRAMESFVFYANNTSSSTRSGDWVSIGSDARTLRIGAKNGNKGDYIRVITAATPNITVDFNASSSSGAESTSSANLLVDLSSVSSSAITVDYTVTGTATGSETDYTLTNGTLTIGAGLDEKNITIADIVNDTLYETNETVIVTLSNAVGATLGSDDEHTYTINDNDAKPSLSIADVSGNETAGNRQFTVTLSAASGLAVTVNYATSNGTATAGADYTATSGSLTIAAGATTATFNVAVLADSLNEADETVTLTLSGVSSSTATISDATGTLTITNESGNDDPPSVDFNATSSNGAESASSKALTVDLSAASGRDVTVNYAITGTATGSGTDF
ncbi:hypothetical protein OAD60_05260, partial [Candidatus Thioglobus sp.]|nr:hypothetical protein [Candidatus Thioglobus sp.]